VGDGNNKASEVLLSGDATLDNTGNLTIITNAITTEKSKRKRQLCQDTKRDYKYRSGRTTAGEGPVDQHYRYCYCTV
jgi:hypothetical protein